MRLLFDENLSYRLISILTAEYPESAHVRDLGLKGAADQSIWQFARDNGYAVVSKDSDFRDQSFVTGHPPKVIWLDVGNVSTTVIINILRSHLELVNQFEVAEQESLLILSLHDDSI